MKFCTGPHRHKRREQSPSEESGDLEDSQQFNLPGFGIYSMDKVILDGSTFPAATPKGPYFDPDFSKNVTSVTGSAALMNCRVYNLGNRTVIVCIMNCSR